MKITMILKDFLLTKQNYNLSLNFFSSSFIFYLELDRQSSTNEFIFY